MLITGWQLIDGIRFRARTDVPWRDPPERYGPWARVYDLDAAVAQVPADGPLRPLRAPDGRSWTRTRTRVAGMSELQ